LKNGKYKLTSTDLQNAPEDRRENWDVECSQWCGECGMASCTTEKGDEIISDFELRV